MTLAETLTLTDWSEIEVCLRRHYSHVDFWDYEDGYDEDKFVASHGYAYAQICELLAKPNDTLIVIDEKEEDGRDYFDVYGIKPHSDEQWGLSFSPWEEWLGMQVAPSAVQRLTPTEIATHCLYEMTFHGYEYSSGATVFEEIEHEWDEFKQGLDSKEGERGEDGSR